MIFYIFSESRDSNSTARGKKVTAIPNYFLFKDLITVDWSGELLDFNSVPSQTLQEVCKRVELSFKRYVAGDSNGKRSGKPRFKNQARFRSMVFEGVKLHSCSVGKSTSSEVSSDARAGRGKWLYVVLPKTGVIKVRHHRPIPDGALLKQVSS